MPRALTARARPWPARPTGRRWRRSLAGSSRLLGHRDYVVKVLLHGLTGPIDGKRYGGDGVMVPMGMNTDEWIADVASYVRNAFGNSALFVTPEHVAVVRKAPDPQEHVDDGGAGADDSSAADQRRPVEDHREPQPRRRPRGSIAGTADGTPAHRSSRACGSRSSCRRRCRSLRSSWTRRRPAVVAVSAHLPQPRPPHRHQRPVPRPLRPQRLRRAAVAWPAAAAEARLPAGRWLQRRDFPRRQVVGPPDRPRRWSDANHGDLCPSDPGEVHQDHADRHLTDSILGGAADSRVRRRTVGSDRRRRPARAAGDKRRPLRSEGLEYCLRTAGALH